jgi:hypothetical protein
MKAYIYLPFALLFVGLIHFPAMAAPPVTGEGKFFVIYADDPVKPTIVKHLVEGVFNGIFTQYLNDQAAETIVCDPCTLNFGGREIKGGTVTLRLVGAVGQRGEEGKLSRGQWTIVSATGSAQNVRGQGAWAYQADPGSPDYLQGSYEGIFFTAP